MQGQAFLVHLTKTEGGATVQLHAFLISALDGREWSSSPIGRFNLREKASVNQRTGG